MKVELRWKTPDALWAQQIKEARRPLAWFALRMSAWTWIPGFGFWYAATIWFPAPLPGLWYSAVPWIIAGMGGIWWLGLLPTIPGRSAVYRRITRWGISDLPWRQIKAFDIEPIPERPEYERLKVFLGRGRTKCFSLPDDPRRRDAVVRLVARKVVWVEKHETQEQLRTKPPALPRWYTPTCVVAGIGWAVFAAWLIDAVAGPRKISGDTAKLLVMIAAVFQPAAWLGVGLAWVPRYRGSGDARFAVWILCVLMALFVGLITLIVFRF
ncbi:MAG: hypothetical protein AAFX76_12500 [Planctomycetota bacterium]